MSTGGERFLEVDGYPKVPLDDLNSPVSRQLRSEAWSVLAEKAFKGALGAGDLAVMDALNPSQPHLVVRGDSQVIIASTALAFPSDLGGIRGGADEHFMLASRPFIAEAHRVQGLGNPPAAAA